MASAETRRTIGSILWLGGGALALAAVIAAGEGGSPQSQTATNTGTETGRGCTVVQFRLNDQDQYVTVPEADAARIQEEVNRGNFGSIENLQECGERGSIFVATSTPIAEQPTQSSSHQEGEASITDQLNAKAIGDIFIVVDRDGSIYKVKKANNSEYEVQEVIENHRGLWDPAERKIVLPRVIVEVR